MLERPVSRARGRGLQAAARRRRSRSKPTSARRHAVSDRRVLRRDTSTAAYTSGNSATRAATSRAPNIARPTAAAPMITPATPRRWAAVCDGPRQVNAAARRWTPATSRRPTPEPTNASNTPPELPGAWPRTRTSFSERTPIAANGRERSSRRVTANTVPTPRPGPNSFLPKRAGGHSPRQRPDRPP